jgi:hypothetical protein
MILTNIKLQLGMRIAIRVFLTDKRSAAKVVFIDPEHPACCGIELEKPQNIWGLSHPPDDWVDRQLE